MCGGNILKIEKIIIHLNSHAFVYFVLVFFFIFYFLNFFFFLFTRWPFYSFVFLCDYFFHIFSIFDIRDYWSFGYSIYIFYHVSLLIHLHYQYQYYLINTHTTTVLNSSIKLSRPFSNFFFMPLLSLLLPRQEHLSFNALSLLDIRCPWLICVNERHTKTDQINM